MDSKSVRKMLLVCSIGLVDSFEILSFVFFFAQIYTGRRGIFLFVVRDYAFETTKYLLPLQTTEKQLYELRILNSNCVYL